MKVPWRQRGWLALAPIAGGSSLFWSVAIAGWQVDLPVPKSEMAERVYDLHLLVLLVCLAIFVVVFGALTYALIRHRKSAGHAAHSFSENKVLEAVWTVTPFLILAGLAWPATLAVLAQKDTTDPDLTVRITGHQWKWEYEYLQDGVKFMSVLATPRDQIENRAAKGEHYLLEVDEPLVVPAGRKVRLLLTSRDVIHSWWVPALGVKQDAIPGFIRDTWFRAVEPGVFRGQCAELCGRGHAFMPVVVEARPEAEFRAWLAERKAGMGEAAARAGRTLTAEELQARGERLYVANCATCHQPDGRGVPGAFPALAGSAVVNGEPGGHIDTVLHGRPGTAMAAFQDQFDDVDLASILSYERNAWGNQGGVVQPGEVEARRR